MAKSVTNRLLLKSRLYDLRLEEGKPLKPQLDEFYSIVMDLQNIEVKLDDGGGNKGKGRSKSRGPSKIKTCNYCKLKGHIKYDCWK